MMQILLDVKMSQSNPPKLFNITGKEHENFIKG